MTNSVKVSKRKEIYPLFGGTNSGKTTTIKEIYRILSIKYPNCILRKSKKYGYDMKIEMKIKVGTEDVLVGITTFGDAKPGLRNTLNAFASKGCNIIFCAESIKNFAQLPNSSAQNINHLIKNTVIGQLPILKQYKIYPLSVLYLQNKAKAIKKKITQAEINYEVAKIIINQAGL